MTDKNKMSVGKPSGSNTNLDDLLSQIGGGDDNLLKEMGKRFPVDLHPDIHFLVGKLQLVIFADGDKKVTNRMLLTEALIDVIKKYERASKGGKEDIKYNFRSSDTFESGL